MGVCALVRVGDGPRTPYRTCSSQAIAHGPLSTMQIVIFKNNQEKKTHIATIKTNFANLIKWVARNDAHKILTCVEAFSSKKFILNQAVPRLAATPGSLHELAGALDLSWRMCVSSFLVSHLLLISCCPYLFHAALLGALESGENELPLGVFVCFAASDE